MNRQIKVENVGIVTLNLDLEKDQPTLFTINKRNPCRLNQGQLQEWTEHYPHTDPKSETNRDIKNHFNII